MKQEQSSILTPNNDLIGSKETKKVTNESTNYLNLQVEALVYLSK